MDKIEGHQGEKGIEGVGYNEGIFVHGDEFDYKDFGGLRERIFLYVDDGDMTKNSEWVNALDPAHALIKFGLKEDMVYLKGDLYWDIYGGSEIKTSEGEE